MLGAPPERSGSCISNGDSNQHQIVHELALEYRRLGEVRGAMLVH